MQKKSLSASRSRAEILAEIAALPPSVQGRISSYKNVRKNGTTVIYNNLQWWADGRNHALFIPADKVPQIKEAIWRGLEETGEAGTGIFGVLASRPGGGTEDSKRTTTRKRKKVLVIDDDVETAKYHAERLYLFGFDCDLAYDGRTVLERVLIGSCFVSLVSTERKPSLGLRKRLIEAAVEDALVAFCGTRRQKPDKACDGRDARRPSFSDEQHWAKFAWRFGWRRGSRKNCSNDRLFGDIRPKVALRSKVVFE